MKGSSASHVRRLALDQAAAVLEPTFDFKGGRSEEQQTTAAEESAETPTSQVTSQSDDLDAELSEILKEGGSSGWIRTSNPPVNRRKTRR
jgi:hypothetical protein